MIILNRTVLKFTVHESMKQNVYCITEYILYYRMYLVLHNVDCTT